MDQPGRPLLRHAPVTPLSTVGTSEVPESALAVIEWAIFDDIKQHDVIALYREAGYGTIANHQAVSLKVVKFGPIWYAEQGVVRPWKLYSRGEKARLRSNGFDEVDFLFVHPRDLPNGNHNAQQAQQTVQASAANPIPSPYIPQNTPRDPCKYLKSSYHATPLVTDCETQSSCSISPHRTSPAYSPSAVNSTNSE